LAFREGVIVRAESTTRRRKDLIGAMLVRAELITEAQLQAALEVQERTLQRLGDVLVDMDALSAERFRQMVQLQVSETVLGLFTWKSGRYAFEAGEVDADVQAAAPLRPESVLMEGFRRVDEWPLIRTRIPSNALTFVKRKDLPPEGSPGPGEVTLDAAFGEGEGALTQSGELKSLGPAERTVYARVEPGRTVRTLVDTCLLGEFDTCKALYNLVSLGYLEAVAPAGRAAVERRAAALGRMAAAAARVTLAVAVLVGLGMVAVNSPASAPVLSRGQATTFQDAALQRHLSRAQEARIRAALDVYRLERGEFPEGLTALVREGLLDERDLRFPWVEPFHYRRASVGEYVLLAPLR
ncbi:MAG: DUF4388 domain-containing protein, partial [Myxococcaceae bacterium]|nr:DUF4388 domain-containing protein [Myxococcaceae bacterium]